MRNTLCGNGIRAAMAAALATLGLALGGHAPAALAQAPIALAQAPIALAQAPITLAQATDGAGTGEFAPRVGQSGKDVIWVPTPDILIEKMLQAAKVGPGDFVVDLGSGDGRIAIAAAKQFGARAMGVEFNPDMVALSTRDAAKQGVSERVRFVRGDIFETDFTQATVVTMYLLPSLNLRLRPMLLAMKPGTRVLSHQFSMGDWDPDETIVIDERRGMLWIVPAKASGRWKLRIESTLGNNDYDVSLRQDHQKLQGEFRIDRQASKMFEAKMRGDQIDFSIVVGASRRDFSGRVDGPNMEGTVKTSGGQVLKWTAHRGGA
jgi:SAM-dependent methyltransferase